MNKAIFTISPDQRTLIMERTFPVSADKLWRAYSDPTILGQWFSPKGWDTEVKRHEFVDGGEFVYLMKCVDKAQDWHGMTSGGRMKFSNIRPETSFEYTDFFTDEEGNINAEMPSAHSKVEITVLGPSESKLTAATTYATPEALKQVLEMGMEEGYSQTLEKLEELFVN